MDSLVGKVYGRYKITEKLAEGGMGEVYAAVHEFMQREAVVKVLLPDMSMKEGIVRRFLQEAQAAARIRHPGIVDVFDSGYGDDGRAYLVMERLFGETLTARLRRHYTLPTSEACTLMRQLAGAVGAAHDHGIVHRDLKPDNVFIVRDPEVPSGERVKVLDFGLAKLAEQHKGSLVTQSGAIFGTPAYMAPEQCKDAAQADARADLYAIGCILYRCLCGEPPFGIGGVEVMAAHLRDTPELPSRRMPTAPASLDQLVMWLLEKDPARRPQSCAELIDALDDASAASGDAMDRDTLLGVGVRAASSDEHTTEVRGQVPTPLPRPATPLPGPARAAPTAPTTRMPPAGVLVSPPPHRAGTGGAPGVRQPDTVVIEPAVEPPLGREGSSLSASSGEVQGGRRVAAPRPGTIEARPSRGRRWLALAGLAAVGVAIGAVLAMQRSSGSSGPAAPAAIGDTAVSSEVARRFDELIASAEAKLASDEWSAALDLLTDAQALAVDPPRVERARAMHARALAELGNQTKFEQYRLAVAVREIEGMVRQFGAIPEDSVYKERARPTFEKLAGEWLDEAYQRAQAFMSEGKCDELKQVVAEAVKAFEAEAGDFKALADACQEGVRVAAPPAVAAHRPSSGDGTNTTSKDSDTLDPFRGGPRDKRSAADTELAGQVEATVLVDEARAAYRDGRYGDSRRKCQQAHQASRSDVEAITICAMASCKLKDAHRAKWYRDMLPASRQSMITQVCLKSDTKLD